MVRLVHTCAPPGRGTGVPEIKRPEAPPLRTAAGFVVGGVVSGLFWGLLGVTAWLVI
jgi:hypothetical protein